MQLRDTRTQLREMSSMNTWRLWKHGPDVKRVEGFTPLLASWEKKEHPAQIRLRSYLDQVMRDVGDLPLAEEGLFAHLVVDVEKEERLIHHYDLENYLTPLFARGRIDRSRFRLVSATKQVGGGSSLSIGPAQPRSTGMTDEGWHHFSHETDVRTSSRRWKQTIRDALAQSQPAVMAPGPVELHLAWRCSSRRNWINLWKPTGDVLGPVLGESSAGGQFNPNDDRIVALSLHLNNDETMAYAVEVGAWWKTAQ
jgi:hypothetical protein